MRKHKIDIHTIIPLKLRRIKKVSTSALRIIYYNEGKI